MNWNDLLTARQLDDIISLSHQRPQVIFKHSTRCSISSTAWNRLKNADKLEGADFYYLDLLANRPLSGQIAEVLDVHHESPQVIVVKDGKCTYDESHLGITVDELQEQISRN
jgi:bacillithiol system protein YtxJ